MQMFQECNENPVSRKQRHKFCCICTCTQVPLWTFAAVVFQKGNYHIWIPFITWTKHVRKQTKSYVRLKKMSKRHTSFDFFFSFDIKAKTFTEKSGQ